MEEALIFSVRDRPWLYDVSRKDYRDLRKKKNSWTQISIELNMNVKDVMLKWKNLRTTYVREKKRMSELSPQERRKRPWVFMDIMSFLDAHIRKRSSFTYARGKDANAAENDNSEISEFTEEADDVLETEELSSAPEASSTVTPEIIIASPDECCSSSVTPSSTVESKPLSSLSGINRENATKEGIITPDHWYSSTVTPSSTVALEPRPLTSLAEKVREKAASERIESTTTSSRIRDDGAKQESSDSDMHFCQSLVGMFKKVPDDRKTKLKIQILQLFMENENL